VTSRETRESQARRSAQRKTPASPAKGAHPTQRAQQAGPRRARAERAHRADEGPLALRTRTWISVGVLVLAVLVFFHAVLFGGKEFVSPDALAPAGFAQVGEQELAHGTYPLWNPYIFCGMPSFGSLLYNPNVYWPDILLGAVSRILHLPNDTWLVLYYLVMGLGLFFFLRRENLPPEAALIGSLGLTFTPNLIAVGAYGHGSQLVTSSLIPLALLFAASLFRRPTVAAAGALGLTLGLQLLRAHVQVAYYSFLAVGLLALTETAAALIRRADLGRLARAIGGLVVAFVLAAMIGAVLYMPVRDYAAHSIRSAAGGGVTFAYATGWSMSLAEIWTFLVPSALGFGGATYWGTMPFTDYPNYLGMGLFLLALCGFVFARRKRTLFGVLSVFALFIALGKHTPFYQFAYDHLPYFNKFRVPVMILVLLQVAMASLAAGTLGRADEEALAGTAASRRRVGRALTILGIAAGVLGLLFAIVHGAFEGGYERAAAAALTTAHGRAADQASFAARAAWRMVVADVPRVALFAAAALVVTGLYAMGRAPRLVWVATLAITLLADLWVVDYKVINPVTGRPTDRAAQLGRDDVIDFLQKDTSLYRIFPLDPHDFGDNRYSAYRIASLGGYHAAKPVLYDTFLTKTELRGFQLLEMLNTKYLISTEAINSPALELVHDGSRKVYLNRLVLPRAWIVDSVRAVPNGDSALGAVMSTSFNPATEAVLESPPRLGPLSAAGATVKFLRYALNDLEIEATLPHPALLVVSEAYYPDWVTYVDGVKKPIWKTDYLLRSVLLPAGRHQIRMAYESSAIRRGLRLTVAGSAAALLLIAVPLGLKARRRRTAA
jgi:hypothetical protein